MTKILGAALGACLLVSAAAAVAQDAPVPAGETTEQTIDAGADAEAADAQQAPARKPRRGLDEIIVTAQKREQDIRDVPISISVVSSEDIKTRDLSNLNDVANVVPNVQIQATPTTSFIFFRGMGSGFNRGFETSVGVFEDGMYLGRPAFFSNGFADLGSVEILRGPQGSLFGKNTVAGALQLNTVKPDFEFGGYVDAMIGDRKHRRGRAAVNVPLFEDRLAVRLSAVRELREGYVYNTTLDRMEGDTDTTDLQARIRFQPTDWIDMNFKVRKARLRQDGNGTSELSFIDSDNGDLYSLFDNKTEGEVNWQTALDHPGFVMRDTFYAMGQIDVDVAQHTITLIGTHADYDEYSETDVDFTAFPGLVAHFPEEYNQQSLELRVVSPLTDLFEYVFGIYYFRSNVSLQTHVDAVPLTLGALGNISILPAIVQQLLQGGGLSNIGLTVEQQLGWFDQITQSFAGFGQVTMHLTPKLDMLLGFRYSYEKKTLDFRQEFTNLGVFFGVVAGFEEFNEQGVRRSEGDFSPKVSLLYDVTDESRIYATIGKGFKSGGYNESSATADEIEFDAETAITFEIGIKGRFLDGFGQYAFGGFWTEFDDLQVSTYNGSRFIVSNAARAVTRGIEFEVGAMVWDRFIFGANGGVTHAFYREYENGPCPATSNASTCDLTGKTLAPAPKLNGSLFLHFEQPVTSFATVFANADMFYTSTIRASDLDLLDQIDPNFQMNARVGVKDPDDLWVLTFYVRNLTDKAIVLGSGDSSLWSGTHFATALPGRTFDLELRINF